MSEPLALTIPLHGGRELRLRSEGGGCDLGCWTMYPDGHAMMAGGFTLEASDLRLVIHALRTCLWDLEREGRL